MKSHSSDRQSFTGIVATHGKKKIIDQNIKIVDGSLNITFTISLYSKKPYLLIMLVRKDAGTSQKIKMETTTFLREKLRFTVVLRIIIKN